MSGFSYKPIKNGSVFVYNPNNFVSTNLITVDQLLTKCYTKSQCDSRYISATGDPALFFLDLYDSATVSNVIDWNKPLRVNNFQFPSNGKGLELAFNSATNTGLILSYNRDTSSYYDLTLNNRFTVKADGKFRFGTSSTNSPATISVGNVSDNAISMMWDSNSNSYCQLGTDDKGALRIGVFENLSSRVAQFIMSSRGYMRLNYTNSTYSPLILRPRMALDLGYTADSCLINLFKPYSASPATAAFYGFGANASAVQYHSPQDHKWYIGTTHTDAPNDAGAPSTTLGSEFMALYATGDLLVNRDITSGRRIVSNSSIVSYSANTTNLTGSMAHMYYSGGQGVFECYDFAANPVNNTHKTIRLGASTFVHPRAIGSTASGMTINNPSSTTFAFPLAVYGTATYSKTGGFGYLSVSGASTASNFTNRAFTIYSEGGILCDGGEIDVFSDRRMKKNIQEIDSELAKKFLELQPVSFQYNSQDDTDTHYHYSYIAQDVVKKGIPYIVGLTSLNGEASLESEQIVCDDGSIAEIDSETRFTLNMLSCIPYLHKIIQMQEAKIIANEAAIAELRSRLGM